jgi:hypothetical protein
VKSVENIGLVSPDRYFWISARSTAVIARLLP